MELLDLPAEELTALGILAGFLLSSGLNGAQQNALGNLLIAVGQVLETVSAQNALLEQNASPAPGELAARIRKLEQRLKELENKV